MKLKEFIYSKNVGKTHTVTRILGIKFRIRNGRWEVKLKRKEKSYDVGIISFNINTATYNFGAALHSYALQKYLDKKGVNSVIINYYPETAKYNSVYSKLIENIQVRDFKSFKINLQNAYYILQKQIKFYRFFKKNCTITKYRYELDTLPQLKNIKRFICNTDVTWCKFKIGGFDRGFLCDLPNMKKKDNIAYSIDFGSQELNSKKQKELKKYAKNFKYISIRNIFKLDYFKNVIERDDVVITIDPVFLLEQKDYLPIIKNPKLKEDYILVYNCHENNTEMMNKAKRFATERNLKLKVINCYTKDVEELQGSYPTPISIEEYLGLIKNCKYFITNSYHGICFAIIFGVPFAAFPRIRENDKIMTALGLFGLEDRLVRESEIKEKYIDYTNIHRKLLQLRSESEKFIERAIIEDSEN